MSDQRGHRERGLSLPHPQQTLRLCKHDSRCCLHSERCCPTDIDEKHPQSILVSGDLEIRTFEELLTMANICQFTLKGTLEFNQFFFKVGCVWNKKEMYFVNEEKFDKSFASDIKGSSINFLMRANYNLAFFRSDFPPKTF